MPDFLLNAKGKQDIKLEIEQGHSSGGKTGSQVAKDPVGKKYQLKRDISQAPITRTMKIRFNRTDHENFGEVLAARIASVLMNNDPLRSLTPELFFVLNDESPYLSVASKYLEGGTIKNLDQHLGLPKEKENKQHISLVSEGFNPKDPKNLKRDINANPTLKQDLAKAIALSALSGNHDVNPGNMIVISDKNGFNRMGTIDFGHAFEDLTRYNRNFAKGLMGGQKAHPNNIIDFFNRSTVNAPGGAQSKFWRDYPGLCPSEELAQSLMAMAGTNPKIIKKAMQATLDEVEHIQNENPKIDQDHILRSFKRIAKHVSGGEIADDIDLPDVFKAIESYLISNLEKMKYAAEIMSLQLAIEKAVESNNYTKLSTLRKTHKILELTGTNQLLGPFTWFKEKKSEPPFPNPDFDAFVVHKYLNIQAKRNPQHAKGIQRLKRKSLALNQVTDQIKDMLARPPQNFSLFSERKLAFTRDSAATSSEHKIQILARKEALEDFMITVPQHSLQLRVQGKTPHEYLNIYSKTDYQDLMDVKPDKTVVYGSFTENNELSLEEKATAILVTLGIPGESIPDTEELKINGVAIDIFIKYTNDLKEKELLGKIKTQYETIKQANSPPNIPTGSP